MRYRRWQKLDNLFDRASQLEDPETLSHWCRYLCVQTYGCVERSFVEILEEYCRRSACDRSFGLIAHRLKYIRNITPAEIEDTLKIMDSSWCEWFRQEFKESAERDHVQSVTHNRNLISHGQDCGLRFSTMVGYKDSAKKIIDAIEKKILG